jgi:hypothetical protein
MQFGKSPVNDIMKACGTRPSGQSLFLPSVGTRTFGNGNIILTDCRRMKQEHRSASCTDCRYNIA